MNAPKFADFNNVDLTAAGDKVAKLAKDALYVTVGAGVLTAQRVAVQRRELAKKLDGQLDVKLPKFDMPKLDLSKFGSTESVIKLVEAQAKAVDAQVIKLEARVDAAIDQAQTFLPVPAQRIVDQGQAFAKQSRTQVRKLVGLTA
jgi:hypothetical protein